MKKKRFAPIIVAGLLAGSLPAFGQNDPSQFTKTAKRICEGLTGVVCEKQLVDIMSAFLAKGANLQAAKAAIDYNDNFYRKLKNQVHKLSNEDRVERGPLNSFTALNIGLTRDETPFDRVLSGDVIYTADGIPGAGLPAFSAANNRHFEAADERGYAYKDALVKRTQSELGMFPAEIASGILTIPTFGESYFLAGTNRAVLA